MSLRIIKKWYVDGVLTDPASFKLSEPNSVYGVKRDDNDDVVVADDTAMTKLSTGIYYHDFDEPAAGLDYSYYVEIVYEGETFHYEGTISGSLTGATPYNFSGLITIVQKEVNKVDDTARITTTRCGDWVNKAQRDIVKRYPGLKDVNVLDKTTWDVTEDEYEIDLTEASDTVAHVLRVKYIDATANNYFPLKPYPGGLERWDEDFPYIPVRNSGYAKYYQQRGDNIELDKPWSATAAASGVLWVEYDKLPALMTGSDSLTLADYEDGVIALAKSYALGAMGPKFRSVSVLEDAYAWKIIREKIGAESDIEISPMNTYNGP